MHVLLVLCFILCSVKSYHGVYNCVFSLALLLQGPAVLQFMANNFIFLFSDIENVLRRLSVHPLVCNFALSLNEPCYILRSDLLIIIDNDAYLKSCVEIYAHFYLCYFKNQSHCKHSILYFETAPVNSFTLI